MTVEQIGVTPLNDPLLDDLAAKAERCSVAMMTCQRCQRLTECLLKWDLLAGKVHKKKLQPGQASLVEAVFIMW